jgi:hypothetical protein
MIHGSSPRADPVAPARARLPNRRLNITDVAVWRGRTWMLCIGFDRAGRAREVFIDGNKTGSEFEGLLDDACVLLSILLQTGVPSGDVGRHLGGPRVNPDGDPMTEGERNELDGVPLGTDQKKGPMKNHAWFVWDRRLRGAIAAGRMPAGGAGVLLHAPRAHGGAA